MTKPSCLRSTIRIAELARRDPFRFDIPGGHDDVVDHRQQSFPFAPGRDLRPRVGAHDKKQLSRLSQQFAESARRCRPCNVDPEHRAQKSKQPCWLVSASPAASIA